MISLALIFESKSRTKLKKLKAYNRFNLPLKNQRKNRTHRRCCLWAEGTFTLILVRETERRSLLSPCPRIASLFFYFFLRVFIASLFFCFFLCVFIASLLISSPLSPVPTPYLLCLPFYEGLGPAKSFLKLFDFVASLSLLLSLCTHRLSLFLSWCTSRFNWFFFF